MFFLVVLYLSSWILYSLRSYHIFDKLFCINKTYYFAHKMIKKTAHIPSKWAAQRKTASNIYSATNCLYGCSD